MSSTERRNLRRLLVLAAIATTIVLVFWLIQCAPPQNLTDQLPVETGTSEADTSETDGELPPAQHPLQLTFLDVGQADALLIQKGELDILVDAGRYFSGELVTAMETITDSLDLMIITHPHADHYGGAAGIFEHHAVDKLVTNDERRGPPRDRNMPATWQEFTQAADAAGIEFEQWSTGHRIDLTDHLSIKVLADGGEFADTSSGTDINNDSLVLRVEYMGRRILLPGDIEIAGGEMLVAEYCPDGPGDCPALQADIFQVPHHGSHHFDPEFFAATQAKWAVFGSPFDNRQHHHPRKETLQALMDQGARIKSTNKDGGQNMVATIDTSGQIHWNVDDPEIFVWRTAPDPNIAEICQITSSDGATTADCRTHD